LIYVHVRGSYQMTWVPLGDLYLRKNWKKLICTRHTFNTISIYYILLFFYLNEFALRGEVWAHTTNLTLPLFIEVSLPSQESEQSYICVIGVSILPFSFLLIFDFGIVPTVWYFCFSLLFAHHWRRFQVDNFSYKSRVFIQY
jgi:hypothetical protein